MIPAQPPSTPASGRPNRRMLLGGLGASTLTTLLAACTTPTAGPDDGATASSTTASSGPTATPTPSDSATPDPTPSQEPTPELPGGGTTLFPGRRLVALYGTPGIPAMGLLGEQDIDATLDRAAALAAEYEPFSKEPVLPAFEIIATIATAAPGPTGDYTTPVNRQRLTEWVQRAGEAGTYVVLDLQPGTQDFLTQAKTVEELLVLPHVGLALDPEWRLKPGQRHMEQIGSVTAEEVNAVAAWLGELVAAHDLPEKLLILHQFRLMMLPDREQIVAPEGIAVMVHADGHGTGQQKQETWTVLTRQLPEGWWMGWKNFIDEDSPTFTPERTMTEVTPAPWFISYQ